MAVSQPQLRQAAWFIDFENVLIELSKKGKGLSPSTDFSDVVIRILRRLKERLEAGGSRVIMGRAYGTWETASGAADSLALMSVQPIFVLSHPRKNSADLELSLDAQEALLQRPDISHFVIVGGDRDYIPVVRRIIERGRSVTVAALESKVSGDLRVVVGESCFAPLEPIALEVLGITEFPQVAEHQEILEPTERFGDQLFLVTPAMAGRFAINEAQSQALDLIIKALAERKNWEMPIVSFYKEYMNDAFGTIAESERKSLVNNLKEKGLIDLQLREGPFGGYTSSIGNHYLALVVDPKNPIVQDRIARIFPGLLAEIGNGNRKSD